MRGVAMAIFRVVPVVEEGAPGWAVEMAGDTGETVIASRFFRRKPDAEAEAARLGGGDSANRRVPPV